MVLRLLMETLGDVKEDVMWAVELVCLVVYCIQSCIFYTWNCTLGWLHVRIISLVLISVVQLLWVLAAKMDV